MHFVRHLNPAARCPGVVGRHEVEEYVAGDLSVSGDYQGAVSQTHPASGTPSLWDNALC